MATNLPLLFFPRPEKTKPPQRKDADGKPLKRGGGGELPTPPEDTDERNLRIESELNRINAEFSNSPGDYDKVLVIEITGTILDFQRAVRSINGLEWLGERGSELTDEDVVDSNPSANDDTANEIKKVGASIYMTAITDTGAKALLNLWKKWQNNKESFVGKWKEIFTQLRTLRRWEHEDMFRENRLLEELEHSIKTGKTAENKNYADFEVEFHFRREEGKRKKATKGFIEKIEAADGKIISNFCLEEAGFHAFIIRLPLSKLKPFLEAKKKGDKNLLTGIEYLHPNWVKYCRPRTTVQFSPASDEDLESEEKKFPPCNQDTIVVGLLDGPPFEQHSHLRDRVSSYDPEGYAEQYINPSDQKHGTAMASLICHGETQSPSSSLTRRIYAQPILVKNKDYKEEHFPLDKLPEDVITQAVKQMLEESGVESIKKSIKIINLSIGIAHIPFHHSVSSLARVLDYLAHKYGVLFIVSAGNRIGRKLHQKSLFKLMAEEAIKQLDDKKHEQKIISPAESINALTVGALNKDEQNNPFPEHNIDPLEKLTAAALYSRFGNGFHNSIKPEIIVAGGRLHYRRSVRDGEFDPVNDYKHQGIKHASPGMSPTGSLSAVTSTIGTSNSAAITTHAAGEIYEVLESINKERAHPFEDKYYSLLIKALLVHGASRKGISSVYKDALKNSPGRKQWKEYFSRFVGYGVPDFNRAKECTESRVVSLGYGDILEKERHRYSLRLPAKCRGSGHVRLIATLAWLSPISLTNQKYRKARLLFSVNDGSRSSEYDVSPSAERECSRNQVKRGTLQHEVLTLEVSNLPEILDISVDCFADAVRKLDAPIPYGLAVTLEVSEGIDIYQPIKQANAAIIEA